jgi:hypothetical protein
MFTQVHLTVRVSRYPAKVYILLCYAGAYPGIVVFPNNKRLQRNKLLIFIALNFLIFCTLPI